MPTNDTSCGPSSITPQVYPVQPLHSQLQGWWEQEMVEEPFSGILVQGGPGEFTEIQNSLVVCDESGRRKLSF